MFFTGISVVCGDCFFIARHEKSSFKMAPGLERVVNRRRVGEHGFFAPYCVGCLPAAGGEVAPMPEP